jgi:CDP-diacylglycerol---glycerol-3-phosphate 3-phosphatidyltransferase
MISVYQIKPKFQALLRPLMQGLHRIGMSPNQITLIALLGAISLGTYTYFSGDSWLPFLLLPIFLLVRMALNALDGMMARTYNQQSKLGEVLNELGDVISDVILYFPLLIKWELDKHPVFLFSFILLMVLNEFVGVLAKAMGGERRYDGPMGKSDRALVFGLFCIIYCCYPSSLSFLFYALIIMFGAMILSTFTRIKKSISV